VLEDQLVAAIELDDHREAIEVLDARLEVAAVEEVNRHRQALAPRVVEEDVLDVGLGRRRTRFRYLCHR
jgi:hypothetical protein